MKTSILLAVILFIGLPAVFAQSKAGKTDLTKHTTYYTCAHHPEVMADKPGKCPKCDKELTLSGKEQLKTKTTKSYTCSVHGDVVKHDPGKCPQCGRKLNLSAKEQMKAETMKVYTCPMHPEVALDKDGKCPKCGKALVEKKQHA